MNTNYHIIKKLKKVGALLLFFIIIDISYSIYYNYKSFCYNVEDSFQSALLKKEEASNKLMDKIAKLYKNKQLANSLNHEINEIELIAKKESLVVFIADSTNIKFWTEHTRDIPYKVSDFNSQVFQFIEFKNNCYIYKSRRIGDLKITNFILIKDLYPSQNQFFPQKFPDEYHVTTSSKVFNDYKPESKPICDSKGRTLFYFMPSEISSTISLSNFQFVLCILTYFIFLLFLTLLMQLIDIKYGRVSFFISTLGLALVLSYLFFLLPKKTFFYSHIIFSPKLFAYNTWLASLGHLFVYCSNFIFILCSIILVYRKKNTPSSFTVTTVYLFNAIVFLTFIGIIDILCRNSSLALEFKYISFIDLKLYLYYFAIALCAFCLGLNLFLTSTLSYELSKRKKIYFQTATILITLIFSYYMFHYPWWTCLFHLFFLLLSNFFVKRNNSFPYRFNARIVFILVLLLSFFSNLLINYFHKPIVQSFIKTKMSNLNEVIPSNKNLLVEFILEDVSPQIKNKIISQLSLNNTIDTTLLKKELSNYFISPYLEKYKLEITVTSRDKLDLILHDENNLQIGNSSFYNLSDKVKKTEYLGVFKLKKQICYIDLYADHIDIENDGYSNLFNSLLIQASIGKQISYARYNNGKLSFSSGLYTYNKNMSWTLHSKNEKNNYIIKNDYEHWLFTPSTSQLLVISFPENSSNSFFLISTFCMVLFCLLVILVFIVCYALGFIYVQHSFTLRLSIWFTIVFFFAITALGISTLYVSVNQYKKNDQEALVLKANRVLSLFNESLNLDSKNETEIINRINKLSSEFGVDINFFNNQGILIQSSQPNIFQKGFRSQFMSSFCRIKFRNRDEEELLVKEEIGNLSFFAYYSPIYSGDGHLLGYFNIPYFYSYNKLNLATYNLLAVIINIYMILILLISFIIISISKKLTKPLTEIQKHIQQLQISNTNEQINYKNKDEIGELIDEYNNMLITIEQQARKLGETEREMAWRTMASQIAHEIKNPLTPMKLKIQQLQSLKQTHSNNFNSYFEITAPALIDQIDNLASIANEFSTFAKVSEARNISEIELIDLMSKFIIIYNSDTEVEIKFIHEPWNEIWCLFNNNHARQVFNNIISNAIQAQKSSTKSIIAIKIDVVDNKVLVSIENNGVMIPYNIRDKIFNPNFTTKSSGMGLGLPIIKRMIDHANGRIWFESSKEKTTFFIEFNLVKYK